MAKNGARTVLGEVRRRSLEIGGAHNRVRAVDRLGPVLWPVVFMATERETLACSMFGTAVRREVVPEHPGIAGQPAGRGPGLPEIAARRADQGRADVGFGKCGNSHGTTRFNSRPRPARVTCAVSSW